MKKKLKKIMHWRPSKPVSIYISVLLGIGLITVTGISFYSYYRSAKQYSHKTIADQVQLLTEIFKQIDHDCGILSFDLDKNYVNFLNVRSFVGSEIGPVNLAQPKKWAGPYLSENPTHMGYHYYVLKTKDAYYIVPGDGLKIDDKILGEDIVITAQTDIKELLELEPSLTVNGRPLIRKLELLHGPQLTQKEILRLKGYAISES